MVTDVIWVQEFLQAGPPVSTANIIDTYAFSTLLSQRYVDSVAAKAAKDIN